MKIISYTNFNRNFNRVAGASAGNATSTTTSGSDGSKACTQFRSPRPTQAQVNANTTGNDLKVHFRPATNIVEVDTTAGSIATAVVAAVAPGSTMNIGGKENKEVVEEGLAKGAVVVDGEKLSMKDVRAYEHERQKAKRAEERAFKKAKKASRGFALGSISKKGDEGRAKSSSTSTSTKGRNMIAPEDVADAELGAPVNAKPAGLAGILSTPPAEVRPVEISLSELVYAQTQARSHNGNKSFSTMPSRFVSKSGNTPTKTILGLGPGLGLGEEAFEWVPSVRAVIAFDEVEFRMGSGVVSKNSSRARDMEVDEPWEYVSVVSDGDVEAFSSSTSNAGDSDNPRELSYADIVQLGKAGTPGTGGVVADSK